MPHRQVQSYATEDFLAANPVFSLDECTSGTRTTRPAALERIKHHLRRGRLKRLAKGIYAAVPRGTRPDAFIPDRYLLATAASPGAFLAHHAALELHGVAHSVWNECTVLCAKRRSPISIGDVLIRFLTHPAALRRRQEERIGVRTTERSGRTIEVTGPERTLIDGFRQPRFVGGLHELVESAAGFGVLDLDAMMRVLELYGQRGLFAAAGWFLERFQKRFFVPDAFLQRLEEQRPRSIHYIPRAKRGGVFFSRWKLVLPEELSSFGLDS